MKNPFLKKRKNDYDTYDDGYDDGFYRDEDDDEGVIEDPEDVEDAPAAPAPKGHAARPQGGGMFKVVKPHSYQDGAAIVEHLMDGYAVVLNIEEIEKPAVMRLMDFLLGALQVLGGDLKRVSNTTLVISPNSKAVAEDSEEI